MNILSDLRVALRTLLRAPAFFGLASGVLALGIATVVVMLGALRIALSSPDLPRIDRVFSLAVRDTSRTDPERWVPRRDLEDWALEQTSFEAVAGTGWQSLSLRGVGANAERCIAGRVVGPFFELLRVQPLLGRNLTAEDARPGAAPVVVLSERIWRSTFRADREVVGKSVRLDGEPVTVVGVAPAALELPIGAQVWFADRTDTSALARIDSPYFSPIGRLRDGVTPDAARAELRAIQGRRMARYPELANEIPEVRPLSIVWMSGDYQRLMRVLFASVFLVLALASVNVAGLLLVRGAGRTHEAAVRKALGASRRQLAGQMLAETAVLGAFAALLALVLIEASSELMGRVIPAALPFAPTWWRFETDGPMLALTLGAASLGALAAGLYPALRTATVSMDPLLRDGQRDTGLATSRLVRWLVVAEIALSSALLTAAGLVIRSAAQLGHGDVGVPTSGLFTAQVDVPRSRYDMARLRRFAGDLSTRLREIPGATSSALTTAPPGRSSFWQDLYILMDRPQARSEELPSARIVQVDGGYFDALRVPLVEGRALGIQDGIDRLLVTVVSESLAHSAWPGESAIGKQLRLLPHLEGTPWLTVVGVARDVRYDDRLLTLGTTPPTIYLSLTQWPSDHLFVVLRGPEDPMALAEGVRRTVRSLDADLAVHSVRPLDEERTRNAAGLVVIGGMFAVFGAVSLVLAGAGVYGVLAYSVAQGAREIAIRRALGAPDRSIVQAVVLRAGWQLLLGLALGLALAPAMGAVIGSAVGDSRHPMVTYLEVAALLSITLVFSVLVPLRRALRLEPAAALRHT